MWYLPILVLKHFYESQKQFLWFPIEITTIKKRYGSMHLLKIPKIHLITPNQLTKHRKILSPIRFKLSSPIINICHVPRGEISQSERKRNTTGPYLPTKFHVILNYMKIICFLTALDLQWKKYLVKEICSFPFWEQLLSICHTYYIKFTLPCINLCSLMFSII